jgi:hypothetical protein
VLGVALRHLLLHRPLAIVTFVTPHTSPSRAALPSVYSAALQCRERGWSVIPLIGGRDADDGKRAAVAWTRYQGQRPSRATLTTWFLDQTRTAYGIVCGALSSLIVVDVDDKEVESTFATAFPQAQRTFRVRSGLRRTSHFYFHVDFPVKTQKLRGDDLKAEGSYVVGPGSYIAGGRWAIVNDSPALSLSQADLQHLLIWLAPPSFAPSPSNGDTTVTLTKPTDFATRYQREVINHGRRNTTLFAVARSMRDHGYSQQSAVTTLAEVHALQLPSGGQRQESYERRYGEALCTIASVYRRPPQPKIPVTHESDEETVSRLSNSVRETLLKLPDGEAFLRTYEGLRLCGYQGGRW